MHSLDAQDAAERGDLEYLKSYLAAGNDPNAIDYRGFSLLHTAIEHGKLNIVELLLSAGADPNIVDAFGVTPLWHAIDSESDAASQLGTELFFEAVEFLLKAGADLYAGGTNGENALSAAHAWSDPKLWELLRKYCP